MTSVLDRTAVPPDETLAYGAHPDQVYDVRHPSGTPLNRTVLVLHGGFWRPGVDRAHASGEAAAFAAVGFHVAVAEYRRAAHGGWPDMRADVLAALTAVRRNPALPDDLVLAGHSAGGHLAGWLAARPQAAGIRAAVSLAGCLDLHRVHELRLGGGAAQALLGCPPEADQQAWAAADPARLNRDAAPVPVVPVIALHGTRDEQVPLEVSQAYAAAVPGTWVESLTGADHFDLIDPESEAFPVVLDTVLTAGQPA